MTRTDTLTRFVLNSIYCANGKWDWKQLFSDIEFAGNHIVEASGTVATSPTGASCAAAGADEDDESELATRAARVRIA